MVFFNLSKKQATTQSKPVSNSERTSGFEYLKRQDVYFDGACQSLRPQPVIDSLVEYYQKHNSCGERVKYQWGKVTDQKVEQTRDQVLKLLKLKKRDYFVSFTLNTTYGINLLLSQFDFKATGIKTIVTSDIEHNSVFLATQSAATRAKLERLVLSREADGSLPISEIPDNSLVVINVMSNIDGRTLKNLKDIIIYVHQKQGIIILDAAQAMAHNYQLLQETEADAICFSAHKMYGASLGVMVVRKTLLENLNLTFLGGGMVDDVEKNSYLLSAEHDDKIHTAFEAGLQAWGEIIALGAAISWLEKLPASTKERLESCETKLFDFLKSQPKIHCLNQEKSTTFSFYVEGIDSHLLAEALSDQNVMVRSGYFCVHYYLDHKMHFPPLVRVSLGYQTTESDINKLITILRKFN
jgi:cysteine desulfurase